MSNIKNYTKIYVDNDEIKWFVIDEKGSIVDTGSPHRSDWDSVVVDPESVEIDKPIRLSFNEKEFEKWADNAKIKVKGKKTHTNESMTYLNKIRYTELAYDTTDVETFQRRV